MVDPTPMTAFMVPDGTTIGAVMPRFGPVVVTLAAVVSAVPISDTDAPAVRDASDDDAAEMV